MSSQNSLCSLLLKAQLSRLVLRLADGLGEVDFRQKKLEHENERLDLGIGQSAPLILADLHLLAVVDVPANDVDGLGNRV